MPRIMSADRRSDASDTDDQALEQELGKLTKTYRVAEKDRECYTRESQREIMKQRGLIKQLYAERQELMKELRLGQSRQNKVRDDKHTGELEKLSTVNDGKMQMINDEKAKIEQLDAEIREWERKVKDQNKNMGGLSASKDFHKKTQKNIRVLDNRLSQGTSKFNGMLTHNRKLRESINDLRFERGKYENLREKLQIELGQLRSETTDTISNSTAAYEARDDANQKMLQLKEKSDKEKLQHESEMKELCRILDHDKKLKEFLAVKCRTREEDQRMKQWREQKETRTAEKKKESQEDTVESYEQAWQKICEITGEHEVESLVEKFRDNENRNFALFNYVSEQNNQIGKLTEEKEKITQDILNFENEVVETDSERQKILQDLEKEERICRDEKTDGERNNRTIVKILDQLRAGIDSLFVKIGCDRRPIEDMLGASEGVTNENMIQYLGIVEQRTNQLVAVYNRLKEKDELEVQKRHRPAPIVASLTQYHTELLPPNIGEELEDDGMGGLEDEEKVDTPFSRNDLQKKVMNTVKRKEAIARKEKESRPHYGGASQQIEQRGTIRSQKK